MIRSSSDKGIIKTRIIKGREIIKLCGEERIIDLRDIKTSIVRSSSAYDASR